MAHAFIIMAPSKLYFRVSFNVSSSDWRISILSSEYRFDFESNFRKVSAPIYWFSCIQDNWFLSELKKVCVEYFMQPGAKIIKPLLVFHLFGNTS